MTSLAFPESVVFGECWARDGLQNQRLIVPTRDKVEMIHCMVEAGIQKIEATSFAHPRYLPQFSDCETVLRAIPRPPGVAYRAIVTNWVGVTRAAAARQEGYGAHELAMVLSCTESHNQANVGMGIDENKRLLEAMAERAIASGHEVFGWALTSFGCPIDGDVPVARALELGRWWKDIGARWIGFGDTTGAANPRQVHEFYQQVLAAGFTPDEVVVHFHDTRGLGVANSLAALQLGFRYVDGSLGAIGGQPNTGAAAYHAGHAGNTCTEDLVCALDEMGIHTGIDIARLVGLGHRAEAILGRQLRSNVLRSGPVPHSGIEWDKERGILSGPAAQSAAPDA